MANKAEVKYSCANCGFIKAYWESWVGGGISQYMAKWLELFKVMVWKVDLDGEIYCVYWKEKNGVLGQERTHVWCDAGRIFFNHKSQTWGQNPAQHLMAQTYDMLTIIYGNTMWWDCVHFSASAEQFFCSRTVFFFYSLFSLILLYCLVTQMETLEDCGQENENHTVAMNCSTVPLPWFPFFLAGHGNLTNNGSDWRERGCVEEDRKQRASKHVFSEKEKTWTHRNEEEAAVKL